MPNAIFFRFSAVVSSDAIILRVMVILSVRYVGPVDSPADDFVGQLHVALGADRCGVVQQNRLAETGRLTQADVARDGRFEDQVLEIASGILGHLVRQVGPFVEHGQQDAADMQGRGSGSV